MATSENQDKLRSKRHSIDGRLQALSPSVIKNRSLDANQLNALWGDDGVDEADEQLKAMTQGGEDDTPSPGRESMSSSYHTDAASQIEEEYAEYEDQEERQMVPIADSSRAGAANKKLSFSSHHRASIVSGFSMAPSIPSAGLRTARSSLGTNMNRLNVNTQSSSPARPKPLRGPDGATTPSNHLAPVSTGGRSANRRVIRRLTMAVNDVQEHLRNTFPSEPPSPATGQFGQPALNTLNDPPVAAASPQAGKPPRGQDDANIVPSSDEEEDEPELPAEEPAPRPKRKPSARPASCPNVESSSDDDDDSFEIPELGPSIDERVADVGARRKPLAQPPQPEPAPEPIPEEEEEEEDPEEDDSKRAVVEDEPEPEPMDMDDGMMEAEPPGPAPKPRKNVKGPGRGRPKSGQSKGGQRRPRKRRKIDEYDVHIDEWGTKMVQQEAANRGNRGPRRSKRATKGMKPLEWWRGERMNMSRNPGEPTATVDLTQDENGNIRPVVQKGFGPEHHQARMQKRRREEERRVEQKFELQKQMRKNRGKVKKRPKVNREEANEEIKLLRAAQKRIEKENAALKKAGKKKDKQISTLERTNSQLNKKGEDFWLRKLKKSLPQLKVWQLEDPFLESGTERSTTFDGAMWVTNAFERDEHGEPGEKKAIVAKTRSAVPCTNFLQPLALKNIPKDQWPSPERTIKGGKALEQDDFSSGFLKVPPQGKKYKEAPQMTEVFYVQSCEKEMLRVHIQDHELRLCTGDSFYIPPANEYWIENISKDVETNLFFVLIKSSGLDPDELMDSGDEDEESQLPEGTSPPAPQGRRPRQPPDLSVSSPPALPPPKPVGVKPKPKTKARKKPKPKARSKSGSGAKRKAEKKRGRPKKKQKT